MRGWLLVDLPCLALGLAAWPLVGPWGLAGLAGIASVVHARSVCDPRSSLYLPVQWRVRTDEAVVALTFDDGPDPTATPQLLDLLARSGMRATFFVIGSHARAHPDLLRRIRNDGHAVGIHTQHHPRRFPLLGPRRLRSEVEQCCDTVAGILGEQPDLFRPPMGLTTPLVGFGLRRLGLTTVTWGLHAQDNRLSCAEAIRRRLAPAWQPGAIAVFHDGGEPGRPRDRSATIAAVRGVLADLRERGLAGRALGVRDGRLACLPLEPGKGGA